MWFALAPLVAQAQTVDVCTVGCIYTEISVALLLGEDDLRLTDSRPYLPFVVDEDAPSSVTISGVPGASIVAVGTSAVSVDASRSLTLSAVGVTGSGNDPAIRVTEGASLTLDQVEVDCAGSTRVIRGAGIWVNQATLAMTGGTITSCQAGDGGAIAAEAGGALDLAGVVVSSNLADQGGGLWLDGATATLSGCALEANQAGEGGAIWARNSAVTLSGGTILGGNSTSDGGGGGLFQEAGTLEVPLGSGVLVNDNAASAQGGDAPGGGLYLEGVTVVGSDLFFTEIARNTASEGGGIFAADTDLAISKAQVHDNASVSGGGGVSVLNGSLVVNDTTWAHNDAGGRGGAIEVRLASAVHVTESSFDGDSSGASGGAVSVRDVGMLTLLDTSFQGTSAQGGGGAVVIELVEAATLARNLYCSTSAPQGRAGALLFSGGCAGGCSSTNSRFFETQAVDGGVIGVEKGAVDVVHATILEPSASSGPVATVDGGGALTLHATVVDGVVGDIAWLVEGSLALLETNITPGPSPIPGATSVDPFWLRSAPLDTLPCAGAEFRLHPLFSPLIGIHDEGDGLPGTDLGAYGGPERAAFFWDTDSDGDGDPLGYDCNDQVPTIGGRLPELCDNEVDDDCDGLVDEPTVWFTDSDGDGFGDDASGAAACTAPPNGVLVGGDCDDADPMVHPGQPEVCNEVDDDCDGRVDEDVADAIDVVPDPDGDGFAAPDARPQRGCPDSVDGLPLDPNRPTDCAEGDPTRFPGAVEVSDDGIDQDCDGVDARSYLAGGGCGCGPPGSGSPPWTLLPIVAWVVAQRGSRGSGTRRSSGRSPRSRSERTHTS